MRRWPSRGATGLPHRFCSDLGGFRDAGRILTHALIGLHGGQSALAHAVGRDRKGKVSVLLCLAAIPLAFVSVWLACALYVLVVVQWLVPDRRIETTLVH